MEMKKILITTGGNSLNKGEMAMVISTVSLLRELIPNVTFSILSKRPKIDPERYKKYHINVIKQNWHKKSNSKLMTLLLTGTVAFSALCCAFLWRSLKILGINFKSSSTGAFIQHDITVDLSGDCFTDSYGFIEFIYYLHPILMSIILKKNVIIYAQSIGPFKNKLTKFLAKIILNRCRIVTVREDITKNYLQEIIGFNNFHFTADSAFLLDPEYTELTENILSNINKPIVGVCISQSIIPYSNSKNYKNEYNVHSSMITKIIDYIIEKLDANVLLIPHVYDTEDGHDDRVIEHICFSKAKNKYKIKLIEDEYPPEELKGMIRHCDLFIGARMHASIAALSQYVPVIAIAYSHKTYGIMKMLGQEKYVLDIKELNYESSISKINDAWVNREEIKKDLEMKIPEIKEKAALNGKLIKELLDSLKTS